MYKYCSQERRSTIAKKKKKIVGSISEIVLFMGIVPLLVMVAALTKQGHQWMLTVQRISDQGKDKKVGQGVG